jgi:hypothetical protein
MQGFSQDLHFSQYSLDQFEPQAIIQLHYQNDVDTYVFLKMVRQNGALSKCKLFSHNVNYKKCLYLKAFRILIQTFKSGK